MSETVLQLKDATIYQGESMVLSKVNFEMQKGVNQTHGHGLMNTAAADGADHPLRQYSRISENHQNSPGPYQNLSSILS